MKVWDGSLRWPASHGERFADCSDDGAQAAEAEARLDLERLVARWPSHGVRTEDRLRWLWRLLHGESSQAIAQEAGLSNWYVRAQAARAADILSELSIEREEWAAYQAARARWAWRDRWREPLPEWPRPAVDRRWWGGR